MSKNLFIDYQKLLNAWEEDIRNAVLKIAEVLTILIVLVKRIEVRR